LLPAADVDAGAPNRREQPGAGTGRGGAAAPAGRVSDPDQRLRRDVQPVGVRAALLHLGRDRMGAAVPAGIQCHARGRSGAGPLAARPERAGIALWSHFIRREPRSFYNENVGITRPPAADAFVFAVAASFTAEPLEAALLFWGRQLQTPFEVRFAPFNQLMQTLLDPAGVFARNRHGVNVLLVRFEDLGAFTGGDGAALAAAVR